MSAPANEAYSNIGLRGRAQRCVSPHKCQLSIGKHRTILIGAVACRESESGDRRESKRDENIVAGE